MTGHLSRRRFVQATAATASAAALAAATALSVRACSRRAPAAERRTTWVDHDGWMLTVGENRKLRESGKPE